MLIITNCSREKNNTNNTQQDFSLNLFLFLLVRNNIARLDLPLRDCNFFRLRPRWQADL